MIRKLHSVMCLKKALLIALTLCMLCMASACGTDNTDTGTSSGDMAGTGSTRSEDGVLDKGGADPTDNISIINPDGTTVLDETTTDHGVIGDLGEDASSAAETLIDDVRDGVDDLTTPGGTNPAIDSTMTPNGSTGTTGTTGTNGTNGTTGTTGTSSTTNTSITNHGNFPGGVPR